MHLHLEVELQAICQQFLSLAHVPGVLEFKPIKALSLPDQQEWEELDCKVTLIRSRGNVTQLLPLRTVRPPLLTTWKLCLLELLKPLWMEPKLSGAILMLLVMLRVREQVVQEFRLIWTRCPRHLAVREGQESAATRTV